MLIRMLVSSAIKISKRKVSTLKRENILRNVQLSDVLFAMSRRARVSVCTRFAQGLDY